MTSKDIIWLAGLLEGEGCFRMQKDRRPYPVISLEKFIST